MSYLLKSFVEFFKTFVDIIFNSSEKLIGRLKETHIHWKWERKAIYDQHDHYGPTPFQFIHIDVSELRCIWTHSNCYYSKKVHIKLNVLNLKSNVKYKGGGSHFNQ
jgi:hypothetical protein